MLKRTAILMLCATALRCSPAPSPIDSGAVLDASVADAGSCQQGSIFMGFDGPPPLPSIDGVVGVPSTVYVQTANLPALAPNCVVATVVTPDGGSVPTQVTQAGQAYTATFTPTVAGVHLARLRIPGADSFFGALDNPVVVVEPAAPSVILPRACSQVARAQGVFACDEALFDASGAPIASLPNGLWLGAGDHLLAWQNGELSPVSLDDAGIHLGASVPAPRPLFWSLANNRVAVGGPDGGVTFTLDGGALSAATTFEGLADLRGLTLDSQGRVLLLGAMTVCRNPSNCKGLTLVASSEEGTTGLFRQPFQAPSRRCLSLAADGGWNDVFEGCGLFPTPSLFLPQSEPVGRRPLGRTEQGVRLPDAGAMYLVGATRISSTDDIVWQSSATQTAIWR